MHLRQLGSTGMAVSPVGFGAFKIGRNAGAKYPQHYDLPDDATVERLLSDILDLGINYIDTAPAYGKSEERLGRCLANRRQNLILQTKVGETFAEGRSTHDFSETGIRRSIERSLQRLQTSWLDVVLIHSDGRDLEIVQQTPIVSVLQELRQAGIIRAIGLSGKTPEGAAAALDWADVLMVEYHPRDTSHSAVMHAAHQRGVGVVIKKSLGSGHLQPAEALPWINRHPAVNSIIIGGLNPAHFAENLALLKSS